ncbi:hypothetical protein [Candidatus Nitrosocosmicus sp. SS]|uniref:hypothetical protein n=1 Tax=Candidatus Nitrosocosmicus agrestis TaxID=2563600 RepID=UPI00122DD047|nr:hypothetical protein [Candidatus Nitrosocosmicus sp. SS]KAA2281391.1 hypothetical protein F1Z66_08380 [Candidatus Nitrosocosmicus sp. SS]KAF0867599.1 hypothetical protein E5N71_14480 [Candidatus Nitrosocosmicus sp. SS]
MYNRCGMSISKLIDIILRKKNTDDENIKTNRFVYIGDSIFEGEIKNKQEKYDKNNDVVIFKSRFFGNTQYSYFAAEIIPPKHSFFPPNTIHLDDASGNVTSFCDMTINGNIQNAWNIHNIPFDLGKIHGRNVKTNWFEWSWKIPESAPKGEYRVIVGIWSDSQEENVDKNIPIHFYEKSFFVNDLNDHSYQ